MPQRTGRPPALALNGAEITRIREDRGLSTAEVAGRIGCDPQTVRRAERVGLLGAVLASRLATTLGVTVEAIKAAQKVA